MAVDAVAVVELPHRVPYGFHALFVTEVSDHFCHFPCGIIRLFYQSLNTEQWITLMLNRTSQIEYKNTLYNCTFTMGTNI